MSFNLRIESLVIESNSERQTDGETLEVSISELRVLLLRVNFLAIHFVQHLVSISELRVLLLRANLGRSLRWTLERFNLRIESLVIERPETHHLSFVDCLIVSISELRVLLLRVLSQASRTDCSPICFNLRIESLVIESANWGQPCPPMTVGFQSQN